jgi:hypothetical protein
MSSQRNHYIKTSNRGKMTARGWHQRKHKRTSVKNKQFTAGRKNMSYSQLKAAGWNGKPFIDSDGDGKVNIFDCRPLDSKRQDVKIEGRGVAQTKIRAEIDKRSKEIARLQSKNLTEEEKKRALDSYVSRQVSDLESPKYGESLYSLRSQLESDTKLSKTDTYAIKEIAKKAYKSGNPDVVFVQTGSAWNLPFYVFVQDADGTKYVAIGSIDLNRKSWDDRMGYIRAYSLDDKKMQQGIMRDLVNAVKNGHPEVLAKLDAVKQRFGIKFKLPAGKEVQRQLEEKKKKHDGHSEWNLFENSWRSLPYDLPEKINAAGTSEIELSNRGAIDEILLKKQNTSELPSRADFAAYEAVRSSGVTNMFDVGTVGKLSGLSKSEILSVMKNYTELMAKYPDVRR